MQTRLDMFVLCALCVYRVWRLVAKDAITARWRETAYNRWPPDGKRAGGRMAWNPELREMVFSTRLEGDPRPKVNMLAQLVNCPRCGGAWLAAIATVAVDVSFGVAWPIAWWLALSAAVGLLGRADG
jgi:hypothetical protein